jgi:hypothetical protein
MIVEEMSPEARTIGRAKRFSAISPITNAFWSIIQTGLSCVPFFTVYIEFHLNESIFMEITQCYITACYILVRD